MQEATPATRTKGGEENLPGVEEAVAGGAAVSWLRGQRHCSCSQAADRKDFLPLPSSLSFSVFLSFPSFLFVFCFLFFCFLFSVCSFSSLSLVGSLSLFGPLSLSLLGFSGSLHL